MTAELPRGDQRGLEGHGPIDREVAVERAVLAVVHASETPDELEDQLAELEALAESAGAEVLEVLTQKRRTPHRATYLGSGRVEELAGRCKELGATVVIVGHDLSPAQGRNLESALDLRVVDRSQLIMDLFASRARTHQARLQVELAQLQYTLPRLRKLWTHLDRYKGGVGMRGPGEAQIEIDRREIRRKIADRRRRLAERERHTERKRVSRSDHFTVGLLGYTSAGKSTLFNSLTDAGVLEEARPFSTLDTRTRVWKVSRGCSVLLSDTIGFIRDLPHHLIASFHATLSEAAEADLLLHVVDGARRDAPALMESVEEVLHRIGVADRPRQLVINKVDLAEDRALLGRLGSDALLLSARTGEGLDALAEFVKSRQRRGFCLVQLRLPMDRGDLLAAIKARGDLLSLEAFDDGMEIHARVPPNLAAQLQPRVSVPLDSDPVSPMGSGRSKQQTGEAHPSKRDGSSPEPGPTRPEPGS